MTENIHRTGVFLRFLAVGLCAMLLAGCGKNTPVPPAVDDYAYPVTDTAVTPKPSAPKQAVLQEDVQPPELFYGARYVRTNGNMDDSRLRTKVIRSRESLEAYYEANKGTFDLERRQTVYADSTPGFLDICDSYDEDWFASRDLLIAVLEEGSGSIRHEITGLRREGEGKWLLEGFCLVPEVGTCDMAQWHILCEIAKDTVQDGDQIELHLTAKERST